MHQKCYRQDYINYIYNLFYFQANIQLSLFHFFCTVEKELEKPLDCEAVSCSVEEGSSKGTAGNYLLLNSELFVWIMLNYLNCPWKFDTKYEFLYEYSSWDI